jgi:mannose-1-phosphate guanylyltransferase
MKETFIAMNGDVIAQVDLNKMLMKHRNTNAAVTDALHEVQDPRRFGVVQIDRDSRIRKFVEKPSLREAPSRLINAGIYLIEPSVLGMIPSERKVSLEREIFPILAKRRELVGFPFEGHWFDIGSLSDYRRANFALLQEQGREFVNANVTGKSALRSRLVSPLLIGKRSRVQRSAVVGPNALLGRNCLIGKRARVMNSILFDSVTVGEESTISGAILASNVSIGKRVKVENGAVISSNVKIGDGVRIGRNAVIHPHKEITTNVGTRANVM